MDADYPFNPKPRLARKALRAPLPEQAIPADLSELAELADREAARRESDVACRAPGKMGAWPVELPSAHAAGGAPPLQHGDALAALCEVRRAVERSTRYSTFSALSGFLAGGVAVAGSGAFGLFADFVGANPGRGLPFVGVWAGVFAAAAAALFILTQLKARQRGEAAWTPIARTAAFALLGPGAAGLAASAVLVRAGMYEWLPGLWLLLYGCGLWSVSFFAPLFLRWLGGAFVLVGLAAWLQPQAAALWLGVGFGVLHAVFGVIVLMRYRG
jgi:hypothetical protein